MRRITLLSISAVLTGCASQTTLPELPSTLENVGVPERAVAMPEPVMPTPKPSNWSVEAKPSNGDYFTIAKSSEPDEFMWVSCKYDSDGTKGLSIGMSQQDQLGSRGDPAMLSFMVDGREVISGPAEMTGKTNVGMRSFDARNRYTIETGIEGDAERRMLADEWYRDVSRIAQYEVLQQMQRGDFIIVEAVVGDQIRDINVNLEGFARHAPYVLQACDIKL